MITWTDDIVQNKTSFQAKGELFIYRLYFDVMSFAFIIELRFPTWYSYSVALSFSF